MSAPEVLPEVLPANPLPLFDQWFREAWDLRIKPNPDAMVIATTDDDGKPSARVVLCKRMNVADGYIVFFTNYQSRKGRELAAHPHAAAVFHWDDLGRQVRIEGRIVRSPAAESDDYYASRPLVSRLGSWASEQSTPLTARSVLEDRVRAVAERFGISLDNPQGDVPRPPHWGGIRLWIESIELWCDGPNRVHDRAVWKRSLAPRDEYSFTTTQWTATRLFP
jgi:pyridoxamine 5'-phosphate oxidase